MVPRILPAGESCLFVEFGDSVSRELNARVTALKEALEKDLPQGVVELAPTYRSLAVYFDPLTVDLAELKKRLENEAAALGECEPADGLTVRVVDGTVVVEGAEVVVSNMSTATSAKR